MSNDRASRFLIGSRVRLKPKERARYPKIGDGIGVVLDDVNLMLLVRWPHSEDVFGHMKRDLEPAS